MGRTHDGPPPHAAASAFHECDGGAHKRGFSRDARVGRLSLAPSTPFMLHSSIVRECENRMDECEDTGGDT